ncbi:hypothetical protein PROPEN_01703 [Proteus penneri ATCC 35198]|nr:hypothetical protein PROPEN_01703 [Proteus penneri ATCC 35198]
MSDIVYLDGHFVPREQAKVSVFDRGFFYLQMQFMKLLRLSIVN